MQNVGRKLRRAIANKVTTATPTALWAAAPKPVPMGAHTAVSMAIPTTAMEIYQTKVGADSSRFRGGGEAGPNPTSRNNIPKVCNFITGAYKQHEVGSPTRQLEGCTDENKATHGKDRVASSI